MFHNDLVKIKSKKRKTVQQAREGVRTQMTEAAKQARREYKRRWAREHPEQIREHQARYWAKRAEVEKAETEAAADATARSNKDETGVNI